MSKLEIASIEGKKHQISTVQNNFRRFGAECATASLNKTQEIIQTIAEKIEFDITSRQERMDAQIKIINKKVSSSRHE